MQIYKNFFKFQNLLIFKRKWRDIIKMILSIERYKKYLKNYEFLIISSKSLFSSIKRLLLLYNLFPFINFEFFSEVKYNNLMPFLLHLSFFILLPELTQLRF